MVAVRSSATADDLPDASPAYELENVTHIEMQGVARPDKTLLALTVSLIR